jgi:hypothetical protein
LAEFPYRVEMWGKLEGKISHGTAFFRFSGTILCNKRESVIKRELLMQKQERFNNLLKTFFENET